MQHTQQQAGHNLPTSAPDATGFPRLRDLLFAFGSGLVASLMAVVLLLILRLAAGIPTPVELFGDFLLKHIDVNTFIHLLAMFAPNSKTGPLGLALLGMIAVGTLLGVVYAVVVRVKSPVATYRPLRREWLCAMAFAMAMALVAVVLFWNELPQNFYGLPRTLATLATIVGLLADFALYGVTLCLLYRGLLPKKSAADATTFSQSRRLLFTRAGAAALGVGAGAGTLGLLRAYLGNYASYDGMKTATHNDVTPAITPNSEHYVVTQNTVDPAVQTDLWRLEVGGLVGKAGTYTFAEVQDLPSTSRAITLECIANGRGDHLIGTAVWQGVRLQTLLERHGGAQSGAKYIAFYAVDGYSLSLPLDEVLAVDPLMAWRMNGAAIPERHGFPVRVLIPGRYGEENIKWLTRIELTDHFVGGLYSDQGWYNGMLHTMSRIDRPGGRAAFGHSIEVGGIAFAGGRGIEKVEVSVDGGGSWRQATLQAPLSQDAWVLWTWQWAPALPGRYRLTCRATDGTGQVQTSHAQGTVPGGATGYHMVSVVVS